MAVDEALIERYVRFPDTLDADQRARVQRALEEDELAREVAAFLRSFYTEFDAEDHALNKQADDLLQRLVQTGTETVKTDKPETEA